METPGRFGVRNVVFTKEITSRNVSKLDPKTCENAWKPASLLVHGNRFIKAIPTVFMNITSIGMPVSRLFSIPSFESHEDINFENALTQGCFMKFASTYILGNPSSTQKS